ncbi:MAG TPA: toxin TcdB middle/C-terminal domain-containing protein [Alphaproteobacteria bacterium]|nr:toxin TcdB middle/C-terminal domain-containing protein [Alphaproteobacteria bacterium]
MERESQYEYIQENPALRLPGLHEQHRRYTQLYLRRILYGNTPDSLPAAQKVGPERTATDHLEPERTRSRHYLFEVLFDYGDLPEPLPIYAEDSTAVPWWDRSHDDLSDLAPRPDPFSTFRPGFEIRTLRLCTRVLMLHHFREGELIGAPLVKSTGFTYAQDAYAGFSMLKAITVWGHRKDPHNVTDYVSRSLPPVTFGYSEFQPQTQRYRSVTAEGGDLPPLALNAPGSALMDIFGNGMVDVVHSTPDGFYVWENRGAAELGRRHHPARELLAGVSLDQPHVAVGDLGGDGLVDLIVESPVPGFYEATPEGGWRPFKRLASLPSIDWSDPDVRVLDLTGDGLSDILITRDTDFLWYRSKGEAGYMEPARVPRQHDLDDFPDVSFSDPAGRVRLADMNGDGLNDIVFIHDGRIDYWPNLGYGRWGKRLTMSNAPRMGPDFNPRRLFLADLDGTGCADVVYVDVDRVHFWFNRSGNGYGERHTISGTPHTTDTTALQLADVFGTGTTCLVWSYPLGATTGGNYKVLDFCGAQKPHLLVEMSNNMGATVRAQYASSTKFYLADKQQGQPWITNLPFPVQVLEKTEVIDHISRSKLVTTYRYHHGYYDGQEREFRGFGRVDQFDTEVFEDFHSPGLHGDEKLVQNGRQEFHLPPVETRTWFHTGIYFDPDRYVDHRELSDKYRREYYRGDVAAFPIGEHTFEHADGTAGPGPRPREAFRALRGLVLRTEVYGHDGTGKAAHPYSVTETRYHVKEVQARHGNPHAVYLATAAEQLTYHYERNPADPRIGQRLTLEVDGFGNVLKEAVVGYGRRQTIRAADAHGVIQEIPNPALNQLDPPDRQIQTKTLITYTEIAVTNAVDAIDAHRTPLPCETRTYELTGYTPSGEGGRFQPSDFVERSGSGLSLMFDGEVTYEDAPGPGKQRRLIEHTRTVYRKDDLTSLLPLGRVESLALPGDSYRLTFTPGLLAQVFQRPRDDQPPEDLLPHPEDVLGGQGAARGGYLPSQHLKAGGLFPDTDPDNHWWAPTGQLCYSPEAQDGAAAELSYATQHFFLPHRRRDPFGHTATIQYDEYSLLMVETRDALDNRVTVGERDAAGAITRSGNDYRVLQPRLVSDPNRNRSAVAFDIFGMVTGTAVMGKPEETLGDTLEGFQADLPDAVVGDYFAHPLAAPHALLQGATSRLVYDLFAYQRTHQTPDPQPVVVYTLTRETHDADVAPGQHTALLHSFSYTDGFGRPVQHKTQAAPGPVVDDGPVINPRWVGSGWTIFNNKGKPVRQYEPFFSDTHGFEFARTVGVSPVFFYDPAARLIATVHPNHTYDKVVFDPWQSATFDVHDTVAPRGPETGDPRTDSDIGGAVAGYFRTQPSSWQTWHQVRIGGALGTEEQRAARKAQQHANTPTVRYFDALGRPFLTIAHNRFDRQRPDGSTETVEEAYPTRTLLDIEGRQREVRDAIVQHGDAQGRVVMRYDYDMLGNRIHQASMEAGERWMLNDIGGKTLRLWDSRGHTFRHEYDALRRPHRLWVRGTAADRSDPRTLDRDVLLERYEYGEGQANDSALNLRARVLRHYHSAGVVTNLGHNPLTNQDEAYDFKGNLLRSTRRLPQDYHTIPDWSGTVAFAAEAFHTSTTYDALNRPVTLQAPDHSTIRSAYNAANLLERVEANVRGAQTDGQPVWTLFISHIDYNARGQRTAIAYGNGTVTAYGYDPLTFRLTHLTTRRNPAAFPGDCPQPPQDGWAGCEMQNLHYTYDPAGNLTHIHDDAQQTVFFRNTRVEPSADYTYDAIYRLIEATGREHLGQAGGALIPHSYDDAPRVGLLHPGDGAAMATYTERYVYDAVGNLLEMRHRGSDPTNPGWTRTYTYQETSLIEDGAGGGAAKTTNRLTSTTVGDTLSPERYGYDLHGNMTRMPHLGGAHPGPNMHWDYHARLCRADLGGGGTVYYVYDAAGQRLRKVWEKSPGLTEERIYLGGFEVFRRHDGAGVMTLERQTLHIMDDKQRIAVIETRTLDTTGDDPAPHQLVRYQLTNHLGSTSLELDESGRVISYEEYTPYGSTSYQAVRNQTETPKRYRYTGKERDAESGLYYHGARYYAPWLGRWTPSDPLGMVDGPNTYAYVKANPVMRVDAGGANSEPANFVKNVASFEEGIDFLREAVKGRAPNEYALVKNNASGQLAILQGGPGSLHIPKGYTPLGHSHVPFHDATSAPSTADLNMLKARSVRSHWIVAEKGISHIEYNPTTNVFSDMTYHHTGRITQTIYRYNPHGEFAHLGHKYYPGKTMPVGKFNRLTTQMISALDRTSNLLGKTARGAFTALGVLGAALEGIHIGSGINDMLEGRTAEGINKVAFGTARAGTTLGGAKLVQAEVIAAGGGTGSLVLAGVAAVGSLLLAEEETRRAMRGEKTLAREATEFYREVQENAVAEGPSIGGAIKYVAAEFGGGITGFIARGQDNLWGALD